MYAIYVGYRLGCFNSLVLLGICWNSGFANTKLPPLHHGLSTLFQWVWAESLND